MNFRFATNADIEDIYALQQKYHIDSIDPDIKKDGFVTTLFYRNQLEELIRTEKGLFVAEKDNRIKGYLMAASWAFWKQWPLFQHMIEQLESIQYMGITLDTQNSYQYGPVCIDKSVRGCGTFEGLFNFALEAMSSKYDILVTFINKTNQRSFAAHTRKINLDVLKEFSFNRNHYYWLACPTRPGKQNHD